MWIFFRVINIIKIFIINVLRTGRIPRHIAVMLDGSRRYGRKNNLTTIEAQVLGFYNLGKLVKWCKKLGVRELTVYGCSIENFKRDPKEVSDFVSVIKEKLEEIGNNLDTLMRLNTRITFIGNLALLPVDLRETLTEPIFKTKNCSFPLTVAFAYASQDELTTTVAAIVADVQNNLILPKDINEGLISTYLFTNHASNPDILIRTSGEVRLSNFLLWQSGNSFIYFSKTLWPSFSEWNLILIVFLYQRWCKNVANEEKCIL